MVLHCWSRSACEKSQKSDIAAYQGPGMELRGESRSWYIAFIKKKSGAKRMKEMRRSQTKDPRSERVEMVFMDSLAIVDTECVDEGGRPWVGKERQEGVRGGRVTANWILNKPWCAFKGGQAGETLKEPCIRRSVNQPFSECKREFS